MGHDCMSQFRVGRALVCISHRVPWPMRGHFLFLVADALVRQTCKLKQTENEGGSDMEYYGRRSVRFVPNRQAIPSSLQTCSLTRLVVDPGVR